LPEWSIIGESPGEERREKLLYLDAAFTPKPNVMKKILSPAPAFALMISFFAACNDNSNENAPEQITTEKKFGGYASMQQWGEHLVTIAACHDCHTPKKMTPQGMDFDSTRLLSGHPADLPDPLVNRQEVESKGLTVTQDLTTWVGPWGVSYTANLTSDSTGIGGWKEEQFLLAIREGKFKGLASGRPLLPPMPWNMYRNMSDDELKAIFAYLKSTRPIRNVVPPPKPPAAVSQ
jgi:hypothetical protein